MEIQNRLGNSFPSTIFHSLEDVKIIAVSKRDIITDKRDLVKDLLEESITGLKNQIWKKQPLKEIEECETVYWNETNNIYDYVTHKNGTTGLERVSDVVTIFSKQECKPVKYEVEGENILKKDWNCNLNTLLCDSCKDGNCDGIVQSGESYLNLSEGLKRELDYNLKVFE